MGALLGRRGFLVGSASAVIPMPGLAKSVAVARDFPIPSLVPSDVVGRFACRFAYGDTGIPLAFRRSLRLALKKCHEEEWQQRHHYLSNPRSEEEAAAYEEAEHRRAEHLVSRVIKVFTPYALRLAGYDALAQNFESVTDLKHAVLVAEEAQKITAIAHEEDLNHKELELAQSVTEAVQDAAATVLDGGWFSDAGGRMGGCVVYFAYYAMEADRDMSWIWDAAHSLIVTSMAVGDKFSIA